MNIPNYNGLPSTSAILEALQARCAAIVWNGQPAFERVEIFDLVDLASLMQGLVLNQSRFCVLVYGGQDFTTERRGTDLHLRLTHEVICLIADRVLKNRVQAYMGNDTTPGAYELQRLVVGAITGNLLSNPRGCMCTPANSVPLILADDASKLPGRAALELDLQITGGEVRSSVGPGPIV